MVESLTSKMSDKERVVVIDGNSLMFRAYYATAYTGNLMQTSTGIYTNALYGFVNMLNKVMTSLTPKYLLVAFDMGKQTFRHQAYADYKGTRKKMPEELSMQIPLIKEYLDILKIKRLELSDYEADDIVGSTAKLASSDYEVIVLSGDKDLLQLVDENITVLLTKKGITELDEYNAENFQEKMGFAPRQIVDYKALIGDSSDNLPGVKGIGPKTALSLISEYATIENIISAIPELKGKVAEALIQDQAIALKTKELATIYTNIAFDFTITDLKVAKVDNNALRQFYQKVEFNSFIKKLVMNTADEPPLKESNLAPISYHYNEIDNLLNQLNQDAYIEVELDNSNYHSANVLGIGFLFGDDGYFVEKQYLFLEEIKQYLENDKYQKKTIDSKRLYVSLAYLGINVKNITYDFMLGAYMVNPSYPSGDLHNVFEHFNLTNIPYFEEIYSKKSIYQIPEVEVYGKYALDKLANARLAECAILSEIAKNEQTYLYKEVELPLAITLGIVEINGFLVDKKRLQEIGKELQEKMVILEQAIYEAAGEEFNISSPKQLGVVLFDKLGLGKGKKNKTGYSTSVEVLESLKDDHIVPSKVLEYRKYAKLYSTYVQGLLSAISEKDGKLHTTFKQALTITGRLSSTEPNIQNIPIRTEDGRIIRSAFIPSFEDGYLVSADYSQIELRILSYVANCQTMMDGFNNDMDLHTTTAALVNGVDVADVTKEMRRYAKAINFGIIYGMSDWGLSETLHIRPWEAERFISKYFAIYPEIKVYLDKVIIDAINNGYTETIYHRRRYIPELKSSNHALRKFGERTAMNAPIQGSAADIIKIAMVNVQKELIKNNYKSFIVAQVHDELILDVAPQELEQVKKILKETMERAVNLPVKFTADVEVGKTWDLK